MGPLNLFKFLSECMCVMYVHMVCLSSVCVCVYIHTYACHNTCLMTTLGMSSCLTSCWRWLSLVLAAAHTGSGSVPVSGLLRSPPILPWELWPYRHGTVPDPSSSPHCHLLNSGTSVSELLWDGGPLRGSGKGRLGGTLP